MSKAESRDSGIHSTLGLRLRQLREDRGWTLRDVEKKTGGRVTASALGSYERLDRSISLVKLEELAELYETSLAFLLGLEERAGASWWGERPPIRLDMKRLRRHADLEPVTHFVARIQVERSDFGSKLITLRGGDLRVLSELMRVSPAELISRLQMEGIILGGTFRVIEGGRRLEPPTGRGGRRIAG